MIKIKDKLLNEIIKQYQNSYDYNGIPTYTLKFPIFDNKFNFRNETELNEEVFNKDISILEYKKYLIELLEEDKIEILSTNIVPNPMIKAYELNIPKDIQIDEILNNFNNIVIYPTINSLKNSNCKENKVFTKRIAMGEAKLKILFFKVEIVQEYCDNPQYSVRFDGYRGYIVLNDEYCNENEKIEYIQDFGIAYSKKDPNKRAIGVFLDDLAKLSESDQLKWYIKLQKQQNDFVINRGFYENLVIGNWINNVSIYDALLDEMKIINKMCQKMHVPKLYKEEFDINDDRIKDYRIIFLPTLKNYWDFLLVIEKMFVNNINTETFTKGDGTTKNITELREENGDKKGSIKLFEEWLNLNIIGKNSIQNDIIDPLKKIRKIRQKPAHALQEDKYDEEIWKKQNELILETYKAIRNIRLLFSNHPNCKDIEIPKYLVTGKDITVF